MDKTSEIARTKSWLNSFRKNNGFSITCGIITIDPCKCKNVTPQTVINMAGHALKVGKEEGKNQICWFNRN